MPKLKLLAAMLIIGVAQLAWAQGETSVGVAKAPGKATVAGVHKVTAVVLSVDPATRTVRLKRADGETFEVQVGEEARNFDQIKIGDKVTATYREALTLSLKKGGGGTPSVEESPPTMERAASGAKPGGTIGRQVRITADVVAVNAKTKTVTVKGPEGDTVDLMVEDPAELANIKKGDQVEAVYSEALAISVQSAHAK
jgi:Cu/Ag efflux protein CusF